MNQFIEFNQLLAKNPLSFASKLKRQSSLQPLVQTPLGSSITSSIQTMPALAKPRKFSVLLPKKSNSKPNIPKPKIQVSYEDPPNFPKKGPHNERIYWKKRSAGNLPLLIIIFEGVLGNFGKSSFWANEKLHFSLRPDISSGIQSLRSQFYIVIVSTYSKHATKELISQLEKNQNLVDAVYMKRNRNLQPRHIHDVSSILGEFQITNKASVLGLASVGIDTDEILMRKEIDLILEKSASRKKQFLTYFAPSCDKECPVTILVPHYQFLPKCQSFVYLCKFILELKKIDKNFFTGFENSGVGIKLETFFRDQDSKNTSFLLPRRRFIFFIKEIDKVDERSSSDFLIRRPKFKRL